MARRENPLLERLVGADRVQELVQHFGSIRRVMDAPAEELRAARVPAKAIRAIEDAREGRQDYLEAATTEGTVPITSPEGLMRWFRPRLEHLDQEEFWVAAFDGKNKPMRTYMVSRGLTNASLVGPKETFAHIVRLKATAFACAHNHPSGDPTPSIEDQELTKRLVNAAEILGVRFLDHIIITVNGYTSFTERGLLPQSRGRIGR